ncbi:MAG TPA: hypothetical protein VFQ35_02585 [Polyangiaceae bacterium]|nr:hypothetical protein [Polyangiaceae bacterium]
MKRLQALLTKLARRAQRSVSLEEALLTSRGFAYVWYRARFLLLRVPFGMLLHAAEVVAFSAVYDLGLIGPMLTIRSLPAVAAALWWGALEELRQRVRDAAAKGEWGRAERAVRSFLGLAVDVGLAALAVAFVYVEFVPSVFGGFDIFDAYAIACSLRFAAETVARTYHAGVFALRRVYRPWWSLLLPDFCEVFVALVLWPSLGPWGFSFSTLVGGLLGALLQLHYSRLAYNEQGQFRPSLQRLHKARGDIVRRDFVELARHALANLASHVDALLVVLLSRSLQSGLPFVVLLHAGRPLFSAVSSYARLFYFDFQRLELGGSRFFVQRFARLVSRFAVALAGVAIALTFVLYGVAFTELEGKLLIDFALLAIYVVVRSTLALEQIRSFTAGRYRPLAQGAVALIAAAVVLRLTISRERLLIATLVASLALLATWLWYKNRGTRPGAPQTNVSFLRWLQALRERIEPVEIGYAVVDLHSGASVNAVQHALSEELSKCAAAHPDLGSQSPVLTRASKRLLVWYAPPNANHAELRHRLLEATAGCVEALELSGPHSADRALSAALALPPLARVVSGSDVPTGSEPVDSDSTQDLASIADLRAHFENTFVRGATLELDRAPTRSFLPNRTARSFVARSVFAACAGRPAPSRRPEFPRVAVYCPSAEPQLVFLAPPACNPADFRRFRDSVDALSLRETLSPSVTSRRA